MLADSDLEEVVRKSIILFNRLKSPQVTVKLIFISKSMLTISFFGGFCYGCGIMDYVDSFTKQFKLLSDKFELKEEKTREVNPRSFEADFSIVKIKSGFLS